ncbi:MAG: N-acetyltransferase [Planctomycetes bacterium]|nr:N-acetyltransferase [Planctomycetota bacterium]
MTRRRKARPFFAHETALVESDEVGEGTRIWAFAHVLEGARIGRDCNVGDHCFVEGGVVVGDHCTIKNGIALYDGLTIGCGVFLGPNAVFTNVRNPRVSERERQPFLPTRIGDGATVGANATIVCGVTIGEHAFVGAGAVVTRDVPPFALVFGVPARRRGWLCPCGEKIRLGRACVCGRRFRRAKGSGIEPAPGSR